MQVPHHTDSLLPIDVQRPSCSDAEAVCIMTGPETRQFAAWANASGFECVPVALLVHCKAAWPHRAGLMHHRERLHGQHPVCLGLISPQDTIWLHQTQHLCESATADPSSTACRMDKVAEASFNGLRGLVAAEDVEAGQHAMTVSLSEGLFVLSGRQKSSPLPDWFVSPTFFTAEHG